MSIQQEQIQIRLTTKQEQYAVSNAPIMVPVNFKRYGLSELVNNLLGREKPIPFEFLIDGEILRSTIASYLSSHRLSTENLITIEYMESMLPPTPLTSYQHDDWISSVQILENLFLTGSYDNMVRLWNTSGECTHTLIGHTEAIKSVTFGASTDSTVSVFSAGLDHTIIGWEINREESDEYQILYECCGHQAAIESLAMNLQKSHFATASSDSTIKVWSTETPVTNELVESTSQPQKKKKKTEKDNSKLIKTQAITLNGHVGAVNAVVFDDKDSNTVYSGGWDHSIRSWDIEQQVNTVTKNCEKVVLHTDYSSHSGLIATGHTDNILRLWDPRSEDGVNVKLALKGHSGFISSVSWAPNSSYTLCSGSYDGHIRVWDIRNNKGSVYTLNDPEQQKILDVDWNEGRILSGGESKKLGIFQAKTF